MALASPWGSLLDWRPQRMILPPTGVGPIAGSGLAPYFWKRKKSLVGCVLRTASAGVCGRNISPPSALMRPRRCRWQSLVQSLPFLVLEDGVQVWRN